MKRKRLLGLLTSTAILLSNVSAVGITVNAEDSVTGFTDIEPIEVADPLVTIMDETSAPEYRETVSYVENKIVFAVRDYRSKNSKTAVYLDDTSEIAKEFGLKDVNMLFDTVSGAADEVSGKIPYNVYYEAFVSTDNIWGMVDKLSASEDILYAEPDYTWKSAEVGEPTTIESVSSWQHINLKTSDVWSACTSDEKLPGQDVVVAVIDSGVDYTHTDLDNNMWINRGEIPDNGIDDDNNGYIDDVYGINLIADNGDPMDDNGHGTHVAGIIAMEAGNGGGVGIAYGSKIMAIKAAQHNGTLSTTDIARAINYAVANGADVINMSFGGTGKSALVEAALADAFGSCVLVASAGNDGLPTNDAYPDYLVTEDIYPAGYNYVIGVMASTADERIASFSNWDYKIGENCEYEMAAPGVDIYSTLPGGRYAKWSGTSMAAPMVSAAAAIIRGQHTDKSVYTSRYIMGQLTSATDDIAYLYDSKGKVLRRYPQLDIMQSLNKHPEPDINISEMYLFDTQDISETNIYNGIIQNGETFDVGLRVWNRWGIANNVKVSVDTKSSTGIDDPYVTILTNDISLDDIGTFSSVTNGYKYENDELVGVTNPIRIKVADNAPNGAQVKLHFIVTAGNGMDSKDTTVYSNTYDYTFTIQNGCALSGVIREDMTLTADKYWILENNVLIPEGVTVTVEPGTQIQFWSDDPNSPYAQKADVFLQVEGKFICNGTEDKPVHIFPAEGYEEYGVLIGLINDAYFEKILDDDFETYYIEYNYTEINNISNHNILQQCNQAFVATKLNHCILNYAGYLSLGRSYIKSISRSIISNISPIIGASHTTLYLGHMDESLLVNNSNVREFDYERYNDFTKHVWTKNVFLKNNLNKFDTFLVLSGDVVNSNAMLNGNNAISLATNSGHETYDISGNYWGTTNPNLIKNMIYDADQNVSYNDLVPDPILTLDSPELETIYPFVTEVYITDSEGNRLTSVSGGENYTVHVKFNRDMASDIMPMVSYGGSAPYTDYMLSGGWVTPREWTATISIDPWINQGTMYFRIKGGAAADDKWLVTGTDEARFFFDISKTGALAMTLQGSGELGRNVLTWTQDDYDTFAGYNLYRSTSYDSTLSAAEQNFTKINKSLITSEKTDDETGLTFVEYIDTDVEQGVTYYYYFTVVDTEFNETEPSNVVACTPLDGESPVITHTVIGTKFVDESITVSANVTDNVGVKTVKLYYRMSDAENWQSTDMSLVMENTYQAVINSYETTAGTLQYYIEADDGTTKSYNGTKELPNLVNIAERDIKKPENVTAAAGDKEVTLTWTAAEAADKYCVYFYNNGVLELIDGDVNNTTYTVTGLTNGTEYSFIVRTLTGTFLSDFAEEDVVSAKPSDWIASVTAEAGARSVTLTWNALEKAEKYSISIIKGGVTTFVDTTSDTVYTVEDLTAGEEFGFVVSAYIDGSWRGKSDAVYAVPHAPSLIPETITAVCGDTSAELSWSKIDGANKYYVYTYLDNVFTLYTSTTEISCTVSGLTNNTEYGFIVTTEECDTLSTYADKLVFATPISVYSPIVTAAAGAECVMLSWTPVEDATAYSITVNHNGDTEIAGTTRENMFTVTELTANEEYTFAVCAYVSKKWRDPSTDVAAIPLENISITSQPVNVTAAEGLDAHFSVETSDIGVTFIWYEKTNGVWTAVDGQNNSVLHFETVTSDMNGRQFKCVLSDNAGREKTSTIVSLTVIAAKDVDEDMVEKMSYEECIKFVNWFKPNVDIGMFELTSAQTLAIEKVLDFDNGI